MEDTIPMKTEVGRRQIVKNKTYAPATGLQSDFEKLLTAFVETKSVRYEEFTKIWRERKFSLICAGRQTDREAVEFMEECMKVAVKMFLPPYGFQARVGALYLLYGLYLTQPCVPKVKIRLTQEDWEHVQSLSEELKKQSHHDTNFVLNKLLLDGAFYFCAIAQEVRNRHSQTDDSNKNMVEALKEDRQGIDDLFTEETMEQLGMIHNSYHQQKVRVAGPDASRPDRSLDVLNDKFPTSVRDQLQQHYDERNRQQESARHGQRNRTMPTIPESGESDHVDSDTEFKPGGSVGQRRARLKAMAYRGAKNKARYKHRTLATQEESGSSSPRKRGRPQGSKTLHSIQRATMDTISEQEEDIDVAMDTNAVLDMPNFEEPSTDGTQSGRKRKRGAKDGVGGKKGKTDWSKASRSPAASSVGRPRKQKVGQPRKQQAAGSEVSPAAGSEVSQAAGSEVSQATGSPTKRRPGRPSKLKPKSAKQRGQTGRPNEGQASDQRGGEEEGWGDPVVADNTATAEFSSEPRPSTSGESVQSSSREPRPSTSGESLQSSSREPRPSTSGESVQSSSREPRPSTSGESVQSSSREPRPSTSGESVQSSSREPRPSTSGESVQSNSREPRPSTSGESVQSSSRESEEGSEVVSKAAKKTN